MCHCTNGQNNNSDHKTIQEMLLLLQGALARVEEKVDHLHAELEELFELDLDENEDNENSNKSCGCSSGRCK